MDIRLVRRLELAACRGWPATVQRPAPGGWVLRATPGIGPRPLQPRADPGIQVSPLARHGELERDLDRRGWEGQGATTEVYRYRHRVAPGP